MQAEFLYEGLVQIMNLKEFVDCKKDNLNPRDSKKSCMPPLKSHMIDFSEPLYSRNINFIYVKIVPQVT